MADGFTEEEKELFAQFLVRSIGNMEIHPCKRKTIHKEELTDND